MLKPTIALFLVGACASHDPPYVRVVGAEPELGLEAVRAWDLGFSPGLEDAGLPECDRTWYSDTFEPTCQLTIRIEFVPNLTDDDCANECQVNGRASQDARLVELNATLWFTDTERQHVVTHEFGHILLDSMHLDSYPDRTWDLVGVMQSRATSYPTTPSSNDYALACYTIGVCRD